MLKNLKRAAAIVLSFAMAIQFGLANSYYVNAEEEPVEPQQEQTTTVENNNELQEEETNEVAAPETKSVELSYVAEDGTILQAATYRNFDLNYSLNADSSVMLNFDGYTLKDVIVNNSHAASADQVSLNVTSELASVQFVYKKVITETDHQTTEQPKTEEKNDDDAEADPDSETEVKEELPEYPAFIQSETAGNVVVHATAAEGVLPRGSKLVVKRITRKSILNAVEETVSEKNKEVESAVALDITIQNKDGVEIQPNGLVNISFENVAVTGEEVNVYHVTNDANTVTEVATNTQSFDTNHFSIYVITGENQVPLTTFNFVVNGEIVSTQIVKSGDTLIAPTAPDAIGQAFVGWVDEAGNPFTGFGKQAEITETTTRTITARYEAALYVYFLNPDGSQIMRTEKVGDHEAHDFTTVSYDVDSTHKLVGWADEASGTKNIANKISVPADQTSVNVYAIIKEGYWVSFNSDGGSIVDSQFVLHGDNLDLDKIPDPTKPGYTFDGWYNGSAKVEIVTTVTSSMTLTAHWKAAQVNYTINYWQQKVTDDKNAEDAQKTYEYVEAVTKKATTGTKISATNSKTYKGFKYNANNSSKDVKISGDGTTIINVYYDRVLCTVNFYAYESTGWFGGGSWNIIKTVTGLYGANLPEGAWDTSTYNWCSSTSSLHSSGCVLLTSFDFESAGYANNQGNKTTNGIVTTCNFYGNQQSESGKINYYNEQADGSYVLAQSIITSNGTLTVHEKFAGYELYKYSKGYVNGESAAYWNDLSSEYNVSDGDDISHEKNKPINIASKLKTYSLSYYNYNSVTKTEKDIKYTASLKSYANYTPARPSGLPEYYVFGGWYKDKACTTKFDFNTEKMPNANVQIYAKWAAKKINLTYNLNNPEGTVDKGTTKVAAGTIASDVLPSIPTVDEYSFAGWYVADGAGHMTTEAFNANDAILKDTNVIGKWLYNGKLTVKYVADGVEAPKDNNVYAGGAKATVANGVTKDGKKFLGWQLDGNNVYQPGQNFEVNKDLADDKNVITLTAVFGDSETSAILNYHPGNGNGEDQNDAILNNVEVTLKNTSDLSYTAPGKDYYFAGWATSLEDAKKGNAKYAVGDKVRVNADSSNDLYATWVEKTVINVYANSYTLPYNGEEQQVEGFQDVAGGYTVEGLTAVAKGKDFGTYNTEITGTAKVTKDGVDVTDKVIVNVTKGKLTISKREVTLTSETASKPYDGIPLTKPEVTIIGGFVKDEVTEVQATGSVTNVSEGEVTNTITYKTSDKFNANNYSIIKNEGKLSITPVTDEVTVRIKGNKDTVTYNGEEQSVSGYTVDSISNTLYSSTDFTLNGQATATGKDANTYPMNLDATQFVNNNTNFSNVKFEIAEDGQLVITPVTDKVTVTIKGHEDTATYDGNPHSVEGYEVTNISNKLYKENDIGFTGEAKAEGIEAATYQMNLKKDQFSNTSQNFTDVEFVVEDGTLTINPKSITPDGPDTPEEKKTGITVTKPSDSKYDGEEHKNKPTVTDTKTDKVLVEGTDYKLTYSEDVINAGTVTVTVTGKGNYEGSFEVTYEIAKRDVILTSGSASKIYDKKALTNDTVTVSGDGFVKDEGATYNVTGSRTKVGTSKNKFTYELKSNTKASNYNIEVKFGDLIVIAEDGEVVVTITGHSDTVDYDGNEKSVSGYDVSITEGSKYTTSDFTFNGNAEAKGTEAGTYLMGLNADQFTNTNDNYEKVTFIVNDGSLTINPKSIVPDGPNTPEDEKTGITVTDPIDSTYDGNEHINGLTVTDSKLNATLVEDTDYTLTYIGDLINVGTVTITIKGIGNYTGEFTKTYQILPREYTVTTNSDSKVYDGTALTAGGTVNNLVDGETVNLTITGSQTNVGTSDNTYELKFEGTAKAKNYIHGKDSIGTLTVTKKSIVPDGPDTPDEKKTGITVTAPKDSKYDGEEHKNKPTVTDTKTDKVLVEGTDYELTYSEDVINAGTVTVTVTGKGNYEGSFEVTYEIAKRDVILTSGSASKIYDKKALTNDTVTVSGDGFVKDEGATYNVTGSRTKVGTSKNKFTYELKSNTKASNYNIEVKFGDLIVTTQDGEVVVTITGHSDTVEYDGNEKSVNGYDVSITEGSTYTTDDFTFNGTAEAKGIKAGTYPMNLAADQFTNTNDNYTQVTFIVTGGSLTITPKSIVPTDDNGITVEKPADTTYNGSEQRNKPVVKDSKTKATLVEGTDYTLAYTDATNAGTVTVTITGIGNYNGTVDTSYEIKPKEYTVTTNTASKVYDGTALTASGKVEGIVSGETYNFTITGTQTDVGSSDNTYTFEWNGTAKKSNYKLAKESIGKLTVNKQSIVPDPDHPETYKEVKIDRPKDVTYDGKKHKWTPTVTDKDGNSLVVDQDYKVTYSTTDFTNVTGEIKVTITGIGNYTGSLTRKYRILRREYKVVTDSKSKVYDGDALTAGGKVEGIVEGETYGFTVTGTQTEVGSSANTYDLKWTGSAKSSNYRHGKDSIGTLTVKAQSIVPDPEHPETYLGIEIDSPSDITYDGKEHKWSPVVSSKAKTALVAGKDYAVEYSTTDFTNVAGEITVTIRGINNYTGSLTRTYKILPREYTVTTESDSKVYDGTALTAGGKIEGIVKGETYSFTITGAQTDVGSSDNTYDLKWTGSAKESNYKHGKDSIGTLTVKAKSIVPDGPDTPEEKKTGITVSDPSDSKYDGKEHREVLTVKDTKTDKKLVADKDYSVTYSDDLVNAGTVTIKVGGLGNYTGSFEKTYMITKRSVTLTSANATKTYDGTALTNTSITVSGDGFVEGEGAEYKVTGTQTEVGNSANSFEYKLSENTLASNYDITKVVGTLTITAAPAPVIPAPTPRTPSVPQVITPVETVEKEETPKAKEPKTEMVEEEYTPKASPQYYWALINLICAIVTVLFGLLLLISKRHKDEDDKEDDETKQQTNNDDEEKEQEKKRGLFTRVLAVLIAIASVVFFLVTEDLSLDWTWTDRWTIWMVVLGIVQIVVFFIGRKWKNVDNDEDDEQAQQA